MVRLAKEGAAVSEISLNVGLFKKYFTSGKYQEAISSISALPGARDGHVTPKGVLTISEKSLYGSQEKLSF